MDSTNGGMFTQISEYLGSSYEPVFTSFNYDIPGSKQTIVAPVSEQIKKVSDRIEGETEPFIVIAHSQGCISTAYAVNKPGLNVAQIILLAPPSGGTSERFISFMKTLPGAQINKDGESLSPLPTRRQGIIPAICFSDMDKYYKNVKQVYAEIPYRINIIRTDPDEVLRTANDFSDLKLPIKTIPNAKHGFRAGDSRNQMLETIRFYIAPQTSSA